MIRALLVMMALAGAAHADGWGNCGKCNAGRDAASIGSGLVLIALVAYGLTRRRT